MKKQHLCLIGYFQIIMLLLAHLEVKAACTSITTQPVSRTICPGVNTTFAIVTAGGSTTYQWQCSKDGGTTWTNLTNVLPYSAVTTATMTITGTPAVMNGYKFRCSLNGSCGFSSAVSLTVSASTVQVPIANFVAHYPFNGNANDESGSLNAGTLQGVPTLTTDRFGIANKAYAFNGTSQYVTTATSFVNPGDFTISIWFKTASTTGGKLIGFGSSQTASSGAYDRHIYMTATGTLIFGVGYGYTTTTSSYNDGNWHQATGTVSSVNGSKLYVDGELVGSFTSTAGQSYTGWWRIGYDNLNSWSSAGNFYFQGSLDDVYIYSSELSSTQVSTLYSGANGASNNGPVCTGGSVTLSAPTLASATYAWSGPNSYSSSLQNNTMSSFAAAAYGTYTLTTTQSGCTYASYTVIKTATIGSNVVSSAQSICTGTSPATLTGLTPTGTNGTYTYQWQSSTASSSSGFLDINGATSATYLPGPMTQSAWFRRNVISNGCINSSAAVKVTVYSAAQGTSSLYGDNVWNIYGYSDNNFSTYAGYYTESALTFNTTDRWDVVLGPSYYSSYAGCALGVDQFSLSAKRTNFTPGTYQIDIAHDDDAWVYINGTMVAYETGAATLTNAWTGTLNASTQIEIRLKEGYGGAYLRPTFTSKTAATGVTAGTLSGTATICSGSTAALTGTLGA
ncbi:MAG TPA: LamG domain-containing protein, partial [Cytophagaceae bacterium]